MVNLIDIIQECIEKKSSDIHLSIGYYPILRIDGQIKPLNNYEIIQEEDMNNFLNIILSVQEIEKFKKVKEFDGIFVEKEKKERFRINIHYAQDKISIALRIIVDDVPDYQILCIPETVMEFANKKQGLVLITGITGAGKSTTLAAIIDKINQERREHIVTIEDPIEYVHKNKKCIIKQREIGRDTNSFSEALRRSLRQDPDIIVVGELRDNETISTALTAAETGHLVFGTMHTFGVEGTIDRIIDTFSAAQQQQVRMQISMVLEGIVTQVLLPKIGGGRVLATEVLKINSAVRNIIRQQQLEQLATLMQTGSGQGMWRLEDNMKKLYQNGIVEYEEIKPYLLMEDY